MNNNDVTRLNFFKIKSLKTINTQLSVSDSYYQKLCAELSFSRNLNEFTSRIHKIVNDLGFSDFMFMRLDRSWNTLSQHGLLYSLPSELMSIYQDNHLFQHDLLISYGKENTQSIYSSLIYGYLNDAAFEIELTKMNREIIQLYKRFNYFEHYVIPTPAFNGNGNVQLLLTSKHINKCDLQTMAYPISPICRSLCKAIDSISVKKFQSVFNNDRNSPVTITRKSLNVLHRLSNSDLSITELAKEMCISPITAHQHIAAARKALGVKTNVSAVVKAVKIGLIHLS